MTEVLGLTSSSASTIKYGSLERTSSSWSKVAEKRGAAEAPITVTGQPSFQKESEEREDEPQVKGEMSPKEPPHLSGEHGRTSRGYPPKLLDPELLRQRRRAYIQFQDQMKEDSFEFLLRSLSSKHKERKLRKEGRRPTLQRSLSSSFFTPDILAGITTEPSRSTTSVDDAETLFSPFSPFFTAVDLLTSAPMIMPPERKQTVIHFNGAGGGDIYHGVENSNVGGRQGQNSVRNGRLHDVEAQRLLGVPPSHNMHNNPNVARENVLPIILFALLAFTGISFFVDIDVLLALLKLLNGKGST
ncbi:hypothetical protein BDN71DRAFT_1444037 [Pleurotus eryngii]|uniref:Transmembrane protein n=1 Tax=Pleurotus eryngii TaxID=5323 RepID=A0A9P6A4B9_PLEER|nr:hypothetical protein BDN71DRAFT_1444037 [Pleurotus eryngii]